MAPTRVVVDLSETSSATLALAVTGVVLSLGAHAWQWYSFVFISGSRLRVEVRRGLRGMGAVVTHPETATDWTIESAREQEYTDPVYAIVVNNMGRGGTSGNSVELAFSDGGSVAFARQEPALPFRLEGEHQQTWYVDRALQAGESLTLPNSIRRRSSTESTHCDVGLRDELVDDELVASGREHMHGYRRDSG